MQEIEIRNLIEQWTRAEIMARFGPLSRDDFIDYSQIQIDKENELRCLVFGTDDLVKLGVKWGILKDRTIQIKDDLKCQYQQLQRELEEMEGDL